MAEEEIKPAVKRVTRARKTTSTAPEELPMETSKSYPTSSLSITPFNSLLAELIKAKEEFENLQKQIAAVKQSWIKEQKDYETELLEKNRQQDLERVREQETYEYETRRKRKLDEDEFLDKKSSWEKQLKETQESYSLEKKELEDLRKAVEGFEKEKEQAISQALESLRKELTANFETSNRLREQEFKAEKEILNLKVGNLSVETARQAKEIESLKRALDEATSQIKEIAVKVIEAGSPPKKPANLTEE